MRRFLMTLAVIAAPGLAGAATLQVDASGQLTGATGVDVGGTLYDVTFEDGTCIALFDGCDDANDFAFQTQERAVQAAQALLSQVFIDDLLGNFNTNFSATKGCESLTRGRRGSRATTACVALIPFAAEPTTFGSFGSSVSRVQAQNGRSDNDAILGISGTFAARDTGAPDGGAIVYAVFSTSTATPAVIPLPAAGWMLLAGLGGLGLLRRRRTARRA